MLTIYLWGGKPVAYLSAESDDGFHVYGFNGKHLGWFPPPSIPGSKPRNPYLTNVRNTDSRYWQTYLKKPANRYPEDPELEASQRASTVTV